MEQPDRYQQTKTIALWGAAKNAVLAIAKIVFGITGHSHALTADGVHSLSDLVVDGLVLVASRFGSKAADREHPYGHGRIETAATVFLAVLLSLAGMGIILNASGEIFGTRAPTKPDFYVFVVALLSVGANELLYYSTRITAVRVQSNLLLANAWHHRSDSASSLVVFLGVLGVWLGFPKLDAVAAMIVGVMIIHLAWQFGRDSISELIDTALDEDMVTEITQIIESVPGVLALHQLRTRSAAGAIFLDVHILVDPLISVSEGHFIGQQVHFRLLQEIPQVTDVTVHVDPEDDEASAPSRDLPTRNELVAQLMTRWQNLIPAEVIIAAILHYLGGKVIIELRVPSDVSLHYPNAQQLAAQLEQAVGDMTLISAVKVYYLS